MEKKKNSTSLNEEQKKAISQLEEQNKKIIDEVGKLSREYEKAISSFDRDMDNFWKLMHRLEKANSRYPFGHYADYYYKGLEEPTSESFILDYNKKNPNYIALTSEERKRIEKSLPDYEKYENIISENIERARSLIKIAISSNSFIIRIAGISTRHNELEELDKTWWCPQQIARNKYKVKGNFLTDEPQLGIRLPYHRQLMIKYATLHTTANILKSKLRDIEKILATINSFLPFAELLPLSKMPRTIVNVDASVNDSITIGSENEFAGDASFGDGKIEK